MVQKFYFPCYKIHFALSGTGVFQPPLPTSRPAQNYQRPAQALQEVGPVNGIIGVHSSNPTNYYGSDQLSNLNQLVDNSICGVAIASVGLIKGGSDYQRGDWPWLGAFIHDREFICGGSLSKCFRVQIEHKLLRVRFETWLRKLYNI